MRAERLIALGIVLGLLVPLAVAAGGARDTPVVLPPFLVEDHPSKISLDRIDWVYWQGDGFEVLSGCPEDETEQFIREMREQKAAFAQFIPDDLLFRTSLPTTVLLFPKSEKARIDDQLLRDIRGIPQAASPASRFRPLDDLRLSDADSSYIFVILDDWKWGWDIRHGYPQGSGSALFYTPPYLRFLLASRVPALPSWFIVGITRLYSSMVLGGATGIPSSVFAVPTVADRPWDRTEFLGDPWTSPAAATALRASPSVPRALLPLDELFTPHFRTPKSAAYRQVWLAESELLVRWAFSGRVKDGRDHLRQFLDGLTNQPPSEDLFQSCFGMGYADARDALSDFLPHAVGAPQDFATEAPPRNTEPVTLREATPAQLHRITGEWSRRTLRVVRANLPIALPLYAAQAKGTLQGSYDKGERDPQLVASLALLDLDSAAPQSARALLEENPAAVAARPLAALALAQLRLQDAVAAQADGKAPLAPAAAEAVLSAVAGTFRMAPPLEASYLLEADVIGRAGRAPATAERSRLNEGSRLFPRSSQLLLQTIAWDLRAGDAETARPLIALGKSEAFGTRARDHFTLLEDLAASSPSVEK